VKDVGATLIRAKLSDGRGNLTPLPRLPSRAFTPVFDGLWRGRNLRASSRKLPGVGGPLHESELRGKAPSHLNDVRPCGEAPSPRPCSPASGEREQDAAWTARRISEAILPGRRKNVILAELV